MKDAREYIVLTSNENRRSLAGKRVNKRTLGIINRIPLFITFIQIFQGISANPISNFQRKMNFIVEKCRKRGL